MHKRDDETSSHAREHLYRPKRGRMRKVNREWTMTYLTRVAVGVCLASCAGLAISDDRPVKATAHNDREAKKMIAKIAPQLSILAGPPQTCSGTCTYEITLTRTNVDGFDICFATGLPSEIKVVGKDRLLIWKLKNPSTATTPTYAFETAVGIVFISQNNTKFNGEIGDGGSNPSNTGYYHLKNPNDKKGNASYLPIVLQTVVLPNGKEEVSLCGATDPRIVNDG
jgi:hypothetical protein